MNAPVKTEAARPYTETDDLRDRLLAAELSAIRNAGMARHAAWAIQGMCNALEREGLDVSYWRTLAADIERRAL